MKIVCTSDIHLQFDKCIIPDCDICIVSGDMTNFGTIYEMLEFYRWFAEVPAKYKIFTCGNHEVDFFDNWGLHRAMIPSNLIYLENSGIEIEGIKIWGSPYSINFCEKFWRFMKRDEDLKPIWKMIPYNLDILITHTPAYGILDKNSEGERCGSKTLLDELKIKKPKIHISGHLHESYGQHRGKLLLTNTLSINAAFGHECNSPVIIDYPLLLK